MGGPKRPNKLLDSSPPVLITDFSLEYLRRQKIKRAEPGGEKGAGVYKQATAFLIY